MNESEISGIVFLDYRKAPWVNEHEILLLKMKNQFGIYDSELAWFAIYLANREQVCYVSGYIGSLLLLLNINVYHSV